MPSLFPQLFDFQQIAPLILRVILGMIFIVHGYPKLFKNYSQTVQFFESVGLKPGKVLVFVSGSVEFFGGFVVVERPDLAFGLRFINPKPNFPAATNLI
ncbi:MAG: hypothetical protein UU96_C0011G0023 [Parcubacteria group bacterium GW2011_GWC2_42_13]|nr:MAG: hypothetical protein UU96_C0011G0023 [Parcubacteria group bacterium GW2011_GWC2_42_13]